jgi:hypothetical protein
LFKYLPKTVFLAIFAKHTFCEFCLLNLLAINFGLFNLNMNAWEFVPRLTVSVSRRGRRGRQNRELTKKTHKSIDNLFLGVWNRRKLIHKAVKNVFSLLGHFFTAEFSHFLVQKFWLKYDLLLLFHDKVFFHRRM